MIQDLPSNFQCLDCGWAWHLAPKFWSKPERRLCPACGSEQTFGDHEGTPDVKKYEVRIELLEDGCEVTAWDRYEGVTGDAALLKAEVDYPGAKLTIQRELS